MPVATASTTDLTRRRLLDAAFRVCAARGLHAATTREIADTARVNEITLFRHFGSKEKLIAALFERAVAAQIEALNFSEPDANDLARDLRRYADRFNQMLFDHEALIRTLIGEARRQPAAAKQVISDSVKPMRARLVQYLQVAQKAGTVRRALQIEPAVDAFTGMLLSGMLRRTSMGKVLEYPQETFVATVVDLFLRAIAAPAPTPKPKTRRK